MVKKGAGDKKLVYFVFPADSAFDGAHEILKTLKKYHARASFFLTGNSLRMKEHYDVIMQIVKAGHYLGGHSDRHILYAPWDDRDRLIVSADSLRSDFRRNMAEIARFGVDTDNLDYFLPPYEWYNAESVRIVEELGQITVNYTPGIRTAADYTIPEMSSYKSSQELIDQLYEFESANSLDGCIVLIHPGTHPARTDKLYRRLGEILKYLKRKGYGFERIDFGN